MLSAIQTESNVYEICRIISLSSYSGKPMTAVEKRPLKVILCLAQDELVAIGTLYARLAPKVNR